jgi:4-amino-4-deoxy-L-arabinose transferase-like glycosyltransferase
MQSAVRNSGPVFVTRRGAVDALQKALTVSRHHALPFVATLLAAALILSVMRWFPFGRDQGIYATCGRIIQEGGAPIRDCFDMKGPATHVLYALSFALYGATAVALRHADILYTLVVVALLYSLAARVQGRLAGVLAGMIYAALYVALGWWHTAQPETFSNLCFVSAGVALAGLQRGTGMRRAAFLAFVAGICAASALWFKFSNLPLVVAAFLAALLAGGRPRARVAGLGFAAGAIVVVAAGLIWLASRQALPAYAEALRFTLLIYPRVSPSAEGLAIGRVWLESLTAFVWGNAPGGGLGAGMPFVSMLAFTSFLPGHALRDVTAQPSLIIP